MSKTLKLRHDTASSFSIDGTEYLADKAGVFELPEDAAAVAIHEWGFSVAGAKAKGGKETTSTKVEGSTGNTYQPVTDVGVPAV